MKDLSYENEQLAGEVLAHYLKENASAIDEEGSEEKAKQAARNIRAAFEALEGGYSSSRLR